MKKSNVESRFTLMEIDKMKDLTYFKSSTKAVYFSFMQCLLVFCYALGLAISLPIYPYSSGLHHIPWDNSILASASDKQHCEIG